jgi:hypothetical protein
MTLTYWLALFTVSCLANVLGLNISSAFNSAVTVYILIPILIIPQMVLSGLLFNFDKLNELISTKGKVPVVADMMASRWAYEAVAVRQFKTNGLPAGFDETLYELEKRERQADFLASYWLKEIQTRLDYLRDNLDSDDPDVQAQKEKYFALIKSEMMAELGDTTQITSFLKDMTLADVTRDRLAKADQQLEVLNQKLLDAYNQAVQKKELLIYHLENSPEYEFDYNEYKNRYQNESLIDLVRNLSVKERIIEYNGRLIQQVDPVFNPPRHPSNFLDYRTHFFAPEKYLFGLRLSTFWFNLLVIWLMTLLLYVALYFEWLKKAIQFFETLGKKDNS